MSALRKIATAAGRPLWCRWILLGFGGLLAGCHILPVAVDDPAHYYTLAGPAAAVAAPTSPGGNLKIGLLAVEMSADLQNRAIALRRGREVDYADNHRWVGPLDDALARLVRTRLLAAPMVEEVYSAPFPIGVSRDFDVKVRLLHCEGARDAAGQITAQFSATVEITRADAAHELVKRETFVAPATAWDGRDYAALAALLGADAEQLGQEISASLPAK